MGSIGWRIKDPIPLEWRRAWAEIANEHAPWLTFVAFYAIFANLPYWIVAREFGFRDLGWFCVSYATAGLIALAMPRILAAGLLFAVMIVDLLCGICFTFSLPVRECLTNLSVAHAFTGHRLLGVMAVGLLALLAAATAALLPGKTLPKAQRVRAAACLIAFAAAIVGADSLSIRTATGHLPAFFHMPHLQDGTVLDKLNVPRLARIPIIRLARLQMAEGRMNSLDKSGPASAYPASSATTVAMRGGGIPQGGSNGDFPNVVLVMVESWGLATDPPLSEALVEPYRQPNVNARYEVIRGSVPFHGPTIPGEGRELCRSAIGFHLLTAPAADLRSCLPDRLAALGYDTIAVHGMSGHMFNRSTWYSTIGFKERWFHEQLQQQGLPDCAGVFTGTCDADIAAWIARRLEEDSSRPKFVHWMTLNSHLPVPVPSYLSNGAPCLPTLGLTPNSALCSWYQLVANVHRSVAQLATGPLSRSTVFVIVGDHAPPFGDPVLHGRFSQSDVPYVVLLPRAQRNPSRAILAHNATNPASGSAQHPRQLP
jgi:hypothetical protein